MRRLISVGLVTAALAISVPPANASGAEEGRSRVSARPDGTDANGSVSNEAPALVPYQGGFVPVFASSSSDLAPGDTNIYSDIYAVIDGQAVLITKSFLPEQSSNNLSYQPVAGPAEGTFAFTSYASNLIADDPDKTFLSGLIGNDAGTRSLGSPGDIFLADLSGEITKVSVGLDGLPANGTSFNPSVGGATSSVVAFESEASNLVEGDTNGNGEALGNDVFVRYMDTGVTERISVTPSGGQDFGAGFDPDIDAAGELVVFWSLSENLVSNDNNENFDVFIRDLNTDVTTLVSTTSNGQQVEGFSSLNPTISADGRLVAFESYGRLAPEDTDENIDVYVKDLTSGETTLVSGEGKSCSPTFDPTGSIVAFHTIADGNGFAQCETGTQSNVYAHFLDEGTSVLVSSAAAGGSSSGYSGYPTISSDGAQIAFASNSSDLVAGDTAGRWDVFVQALARPALEAPPAVTIAVTPAVGSAHTVRLEATIQDPNGLADVASAAVSIVDRKGRTLGSWSLADFAASGGVLQLVDDVDLKGPGSFTATISATDSGGLSTSTSTIFAR